VAVVVLVRELIVTAIEAEQLHILVLVVVVEALVRLLRQMVK
jgi:hypothetical protein